MATEEELQEWQRQQDAFKDQLKAQINRSLITSVEYPICECGDEWEMTIRGKWQDEPV